MTRKRSPRRTIESFAAALAGARSEALNEVPADKRRFPDPLCLDREAEFSDYDVPPRQEEAMALCSDCPLIRMCMDNARRTKPAWTVAGGVAWVEGRQAHLLAPERLAEALERMRPLQ